MIISIFENTDIPSDIIGIVSIIITIVFGVAGLAAAGVFIYKRINNQKAKAKFKGDNNIVIQNSKIDKR